MMRVARPPFALVLVAAAFTAALLTSGVLMLGGCGGRGDSVVATGAPSAGTEVKKVAIVTPEKANDYG